jgi:hypothetical protein
MPKSQGNVKHFSCFLSIPFTPPAAVSSCVPDGASRSLPASSIAARVTATPFRFPLAATRNGPAPDASISIQNASTSIAATHFVHITHPFHPLSGKQLACVGERYNRYGRRLLLRVDDATVCSVPPQWTDLAAPDPEIVIGEYRALFRVADLLELARLVDQLRSGSAVRSPDGV